MVLVRGPVEFRMGSPLWEADRDALTERPHVRRIPRSYAIAATSVTVAQFKRFLKEVPDVGHSYVERYSPEAVCPIVSVTWCEAAAYCNWLSQKEGIPEDQWCYPNKIALGMKPYADYLSRTGYRLPSETELEYAVKAGSAQSRHYGSALDLLPRYAHFLDNGKGRSWPVGQKRPNDVGLCDGHGNAYNWCSEAAHLHPYRRSAISPIDSEDAKLVDEPTIRALRGGSFGNSAPGLRASCRNGFGPAGRNYYYGLRVCRTLPPDHFTTLPPAEVRDGRK
jgi:formylglycine-generating enzyme required for sulfatase activity